MVFPFSGWVLWFSAPSPFIVLPVDWLNDFLFFDASPGSVVTLFLGSVILLSQGVPRYFFLARLRFTSPHLLGRPPVINLRLRDRDNPRWLPNWI